MPSVFRRVALAVGAALVLSLGAAPAAQRSSAPSAPAPPAQKQDADFAAQVKTWTTKPEFLTPPNGSRASDATIPLMNTIPDSISAMN